MGFFRRRNPSATTWILIAGGAAAVVGGGLGIWAWRRKKAQGEILPPSPTNGGGGTRPSGGGGGGGAPSFPGERRQLELDTATGRLTIFVTDSPTVPPSSSKMDQIADQAYQDAYPEGPFPIKGTSGSWKPWADAWKRIRAHVSSLVNVTYGAQ
jgi:LPXTG-motif cell wall-anchored protein